MDTTKLQQQEKIIINPENYNNLSLLFNSSDGEEQELILSFYEKLCIDENLIYLLLIMKLSHHDIQHFKLKYPQMLNKLTLADKDDFKFKDVNYISYGVIAKFLSLDIKYTAESLQLYIKLFCEYNCRQMFSDYKVVLPEERIIITRINE